MPTDRLQDIEKAISAWINWFVTDAVVDMGAVKRNDELLLFHYKVSTWELNYRLGSLIVYADCGLCRRVIFAALPLYDSKWIIHFRAT